MRNIVFITIVAFLLATAQSTQAYACSVAPRRAEIDKQLRELIQSADYVFTGQVARVIRRAWGPEDELGSYEKRWKRLDAAGREVPDYIQNMMDYSDATARLSIQTSLRDDGFEDRGGYYRLGKKMIDIDLLRPFSMAGHGPCTNFPRTCPWDIKTGDFVVVAVEEQGALPFTATYCLRIERPKLNETNRILELRGKFPAEDVLWSYVEASRLRNRLQNIRPPKRAP